MKNVLKGLLIVLGGLMIGFGIGMVVANSFIFGEAKYWVAVIGSLTLGGFLMALGLTGREEEIKEEKEEGGRKEEEKIEIQEKELSPELGKKSEDDK